MVLRHSLAHIVRLQLGVCSASTLPGEIFFKLDALLCPFEHSTPSLFDASELSQISAPRSGPGSWNFKRVKRQGCDWKEMSRERAAEKRASIEQDVDTKQMPRDRERNRDVIRKT